MNSEIACAGKEGEIGAKGQKGTDRVAPSINGAFVRSRAQEVFRGTSLLLSEGMPSVPRDGALLGIAFYSLPDLVILDDLVERSRDSSHSRNVRVRVFDILVFKSMQDVETVFPGLVPAYGTPMIGVWARRQLMQKGWGEREAQRIARALCM